MTELSNLGQFPPMQYDFGAHWNPVIKPLLRHLPLSREVERLKLDYVAMMFELHEAGDLGSGPDADLFLQAKLLEAEARCRSLHWLRETWEASELAQLALAIASKLHPSEELEVIGTPEMHSVVTNRARTIVYDMKLYDRLSAWESLIYAGETTGVPRHVTTRRLSEYLDERWAKTAAAVQRVRAFGNSAVV